MICDEPELTTAGDDCIYNQAECEFCGRSIIGRTRDNMLYAECNSCRDDMTLLNRAGKLVIA